MRYKILAGILVLLLGATAFALPPTRGSQNQQFSTSLDTKTWIDANKIMSFVTNKGSFAYDQGALFHKNDGLYFPFSSTEDIEDGSNTLSVIFAAGVWMGAVDAATGIPTGVGSLFVVDTHGQGVPAGFQFFGNIEIEADVAIRSAADLLPVHPHLGIHVGAIEENQVLLRGIDFVDLDLFPIPTDSGRQISTLSAGGVLLGIWAKDGPVMGNRDRFPLGIIEAGFRCPG